MSRNQRCRNIWAPLKLAGLVRDRRQGRETHYSAETQRGSFRWSTGWVFSTARSGATRFDLPRRPPQKDGPMNNTATETLSVVVERELRFPPGKDLARAHAAALDRGVADEERLRGLSWTTVSACEWTRNRTGTASSTVRSSSSSRTRRCPTRGAPSWYGRSVVTLTLTPTSSWNPPAHGAVGISGPHQQQNYQGAKYGSADNSLRTWSRSWRGPIEICLRNSRQVQWRCRWISQSTDWI